MFTILRRIAYLGKAPPFQERVELDSREGPAIHQFDVSPAIDNGRNWNRPCRTDYQGMEILRAS